MKTFPCTDFCFWCKQPFERLSLRHIYGSDDCQRAYEEARMAAQAESARKTGQANVGRRRSVKGGSE